MRGAEPAAYFDGTEAADAQTARVHQQEAGFAGRLPYTANDRARFGV
jgi:hypothetical protein